MNDFNALLLIDCWEESWIKIRKPVLPREFYARIIDFTENINFDQVFFCSSFSPYVSDSNDFKTHHWLEEFYKNHIYVHSMDYLNTYLDKGSSILVGGGSWQGCLHKKRNINLNILRTDYDVISHPMIVADQFSENRITENHFLKDNIKWVKKENGFFLAHRIIPAL